MIITDGIHIIHRYGDVKELHRFARKAGINRCWFDANPRHPHYDKPKRMPLWKLVNAGAEYREARALAKMMRNK